MSLLDHEADPATHAEDEALIKEARRLRRRRWFFGCAITALVIGAGVAGYLIASGPPAASHRMAPSRSSGAPSSSASVRAAGPTRSPDLIQPTTLAALPDGELLILDSSRDQILKLRADGDLSVFAGTGRLGFSGDGGPARDAELDFGYFSSAGMSLTPNGSVDFLDDGNCRIRQINPDGIIRTLVRIPLIKVSGAPHATACPAKSVAVSPAGGVYVATNGQIERLSAKDHLVWVAGKQGSVAVGSTHLTSSTVAFSPDSLAFNRAGDLDIANFSPKVILQLTPAGRLTDLGASYADQLTLDPNGQILAGTHGGEIQEVTSTGINPFYNVIPRRAGLDWGTDQGFQENGIAVTKSGTIYVDNAQGNGYGAGTVLVRITPAKHATLAPIRTSLSATLPKLGAPGFPATLYPPTRPTHGTTLRSCPSNAGLEQFTPRAITKARKIARGYLSNQFASDIIVTDRSWWTSDFNDFVNGDDLGAHTVTGEMPASATPAAIGLTKSCGLALVNDSIAVTVGQSSYSDFSGTLYFLDRHGHPLVYDVR